ncbi:MAG: hypothetical protein K9K64_16990, partial [Desulfohalobiaceae bacterium]|nr:hypothetical protein [Desulfohalobiaceae bacterium]
YAIKAQAELALQDICESEVTVNEGFVTIRVLGPRIKKTEFITPKLQGHLDLTFRDELQQEIDGIIREIPGVKGMTCDIEHPHYY